MDLLNQNDLYENIKTLLNQARSHVVYQVNVTMTKTYFLIGRMIVQDE